MILIQLVFVLVILYILRVVYENWDNLIHIVYSLTNSTTFMSVPTNQHLLKDVEQMIQYNIPKPEIHTFVDFGSGYGTLLIDMLHKYNKLVGVELDETSHSQASQLLQTEPSVTLHNMPMQNYTFEDEPTILYMYEPLFDVKDPQIRHDVYSSVMKNLSRLKQSVYVVYVSRNALSCFMDGFAYESLAFTKNGFQLIAMKKSLLWPMSRNIYVYQLKSPNTERF